jgi:acyl carrier protein
MTSKVNDNLEKELSEMIFDACQIEDMKPEELAPEDVLFGPDSPVGLDSLDAVEIAVALQKKFNVRIEAGDKNFRVMECVRSLANFVRKQQEVAAG